MADGRLVIGTQRYSSWSLRGWLAVRMAELAVTIEVIPLEGGVTPAILAISPSGRVPYLEHDGARIWDSLAIAEYCAEHKPGLWPADRVARAHARAISAEMHSGFAAMRAAMPMVLGRDYEGLPLSPETQADIRRVDMIWAETRAAFGVNGPFLFGEAFTLADAMFAPVVTRFLTYKPELSAPAAAYCAAVRAHALLAEWYDQAAQEPAEWKLSKYERLLP